MKKLSKTMLCALASVTLLSAFPTSNVYADKKQEKARLEEKIKLNNQVIQNNQQEKAELDAQIQEIEAQLNEVLSKYKNIDVLIAENNQQINDLSADIEKTKKQLLVDDYNSMINNLGVYLFAHKSLLESPSKLKLEDSLDKQKRLSEMNNKLIELYSIKSDLVIQQNLQKESVDEVNAIYEELLNKIMEKIQFENYLRTENQMNEKELENIRKQLRAEIRKQDMYTYLANRGDNWTASGTSIVNTAKQYLGVRYVWGGESPRGFDCSGLTQYVMALNGISIPRTTDAQMRIGKTVAYEDMQPGDLIFFDLIGVNNGNASHVGIYAGNGKMIHAPRPGQRVEIVPLGRYWKNGYITTKRLVN